MRGSVPIPELVEREPVWLTLVITSVRKVRTQQGLGFYLAVGRNASGRIPLKILPDAAGELEMRAGLWGVVGHLETYQNQPQFLASECRTISAEMYREHHAAEPDLPRAYTIDIETVALPAFQERVRQRLKRDARSGKMRAEQLERYERDAIAEEEQSYRLGSLAATSGRVLSIAVHVAPVAGLEISGASAEESEHVFGIDADGREQPERDSLEGFIQLMSDFDWEGDEVVGHNVAGFDLPFIFQRCLVNGITAARLVSLAEPGSRNVYDTMHRWWLGARNRVSLDDIAWALGIESSKSDELEGSRIFELYYSGRLSEIREYNLNDVRVTRLIYERMIETFGRPL